MAAITLWYDAFLKRAELLASAVLGPIALQRLLDGGEQPLVAEGACTDPSPRPAVHRATG